MLGGSPATPYETWALSKGLTTGQGDDEDLGGKTNFYEFSLGGDPNHASDDGKLVHHFTTDVVGGPEPEFVLTILVRAETAFAAAGNTQTATHNGVVYTVTGSTGLANPLVSDVEILPTAAVTTNLAPQPSGYEYVSFFVAGSTASLPKGFVQVSVEAE